MIVIRKMDADLWMKLRSMGEKVFRDEVTSHALHSVHSVCCCK